MLQSYLDTNPVLDARVYIHKQAVVIGDVELSEDCSVWPCAVIRGDVNSIRIGQRTNIQDHSMLHVTHVGEYTPEGSPLVIGNDVTIGHHVTLHGCKIGNRVLVGIGATILDNVVIPDDVMIGAHTLVPPNKQLESGFLYIGSPVKPARTLTDKEISFLKYSAEHYVRLKDNYL